VPAGDDPLPPPPRSRPRPRVDVNGVDYECRGPPSPAQLVQGGVAGDPEQPRALLATVAVERPAAAKGPLERHSCHILSRRAVAEQRHRVGIHVVAGPPIQLLEALPGRPIGEGRIFAHTLTTNVGPIRHSLAYTLLARAPNSRGSLLITPVTPSACSASSLGSSSTVHT